MAKENREKTIESSADRGVTRKAFLDLLMELSNDGTKFTDEELREEVDTMMIAVRQKEKKKKLRYSLEE